MAIVDTMLNLNRVGYGAMQLAGKHVFGPPADPENAKAVLRRAVELGVDHIDTSDFYGPHVVNELIKAALHPYPEHLAIVTKVGYRRTPDGDWVTAREPGQLRDAVHDNLRRLGLERLDVVNLRVGGADDPGSVEEPFTVLAELREQGLVRDLGLSNVRGHHLDQALSIAPVVCVQNLYNVAERRDDELLDRTTAEGIAYVPFFPLGGFTPLQHATLGEVAARHGATERQVALAWLLHRAPNVLLIPGTSSTRHLEENLASADLHLSEHDLTQLDTIG
ncbi:aryl-alcohol dehydrogenase-like predicted oxidoreductase [Saccharothrix saharensis]|uniref:Aryl-alcohol dehydrogenase-like predicted oxidoreductase n=1 Tax=Saccharothrix saharensis TaxID=571190 RepID=A0A543JHU3_9PSEU|nr:oxidoreductase [Saccharothrix saharensis]TQM82331.1 aryl-alcohol dehydrogenase-like predicted oxidoreductase [Saccharothrix saharensis]